MVWLVCKNKDDASLFVTTRSARETMLSVIHDLGQQPDSIVLKSFATFEDADKYKKEIEDADRKINKAIK